jgi:DNA-binding YbaB/EbfC family protein
MDLNQIMRKASELQKKLNEAQEKIEKAEYEGVSGAGMVKIKINGKHDIINVDIDKSIINPAEKEIMEALIIAAFNDAMVKASAQGKKTMADATGGISMPAGFNLPF